MEGITNKRHTVEELEVLIPKYAKEYYTTGHSCISDEDFDSLVDELRELDPSHELLESVGWGAFADGVSGKTAPHPYGPMGSLPKYKTVEDAKLLENKNYSGKLDGLTVDLTYISGELELALTRGNGVEGQVITHKVRSLVPSKLPYPITGSFRGEFVLSKENWETYYSDQPSARNVASGMLNRKDTDPEELSRFDIIVYKVHGYYTDTVPEELREVIKSRQSQWDLLRYWGFNVVTNLSTEKSTVTYADAYSNLIRINGKTYPCDGIVESPLVAKFEYTDDNSQVYVNYEGEIAHKVVTETADVTIKDITYRKTRTGRIVPRVWFEPISISGAVVQKATGNNCKYLVENGLDVGAKITIIRSGEVIPNIYKVLTPAETVQLPTVCPECSHQLEWVGKDLVCNNANCSASSSERIHNWIGYTCSVDKLGPKLIDALIEGLEVRTVEDLYEITTLEDLSRSSGIGDSKIRILENMLDKLHNEKLSITSYLVAFSLPKLGWNSASKLNTPEFYKLVTTEGSDPMEYLDSVKGVIYKSKLAIMENWSLIQSRSKLVNLINPEDINEESSNESSDKLKVCVTGRLTLFKTRKDLFTQLSDSVVETKVSECQYLVCNEDKSSPKLKYAKESPTIQIISDEELVKIINNK